jgi:hypothetical protein
MVWVSNPDTAKKFLSSPKRQNWLWGPLTLFFKTNTDVLSRGKGSRCLKLKCSPHFNVDIKNERGYTPTPLYTPSWRGERKILFPNRLGYDTVQYDR